MPCNSALLAVNGLIRDTTIVWVRDESDSLEEVGKFPPEQHGGFKGAIQCLCQLHVQYLFPFFHTGELGIRRVNFDEQLHHHVSKAHVHHIVHVSLHERSRQVDRGHVS
jgi:hypothetical protein